MKSDLGRLETFFRKPLKLQSPNLRALAEARGIWNSVLADFECEVDSECQGAVFHDATPRNAADGPPEEIIGATAS
jgi:hypothetical protein